MSMDDDIHRFDIGQEVQREIRRSIEKHGDTDKGIPNGTSDGVFAVHRRDRAIHATDSANAAGVLTWLHILNEEVQEAFAETDDAKLRVELVQVAAMAQKWIAAIDARKEAS